MTTRKIGYGSQAKRDAKKHHLMLLTAEWAEVLHKLVANAALPEKYKDHALVSNWVGYRECHVKPDFLLIYKIVDDNQIILVRLGSHGELF